MTGRRRHLLALAALVLLGGVLRFWALDTGLPHPMTRPDEEVIVGRTAMPAQGKFDLRWESYPSAYVYLTWLWATIGVRAVQAFGDAPAAGYLDVLRARLDAVILVARALSAAAGTATVALTGVLAGRALGPGAGLAAAALLATSFLHVRDSHYVKPDALLALAVLCTVGAAVPLAVRATRLRAVGAGLALGAAAAMKYPAAILGAVTYAAACAGGAARGRRRLASKPGATALATAALAFAATSPFVLLNPTTFRKVLEIVAAAFPQAAPVPAPTLPPIAGYPDWMQRAWWEGLVYHAAFSLRYGTGIAVTLLAPIAVVWGFAHRHPLTRLAAAAVLVWYGFFGLSKITLARYVTPLVPLLAILEGGLLSAAAARLGTPRRAATGLAFATLAIAAEPLVASVAFDRLAAREDTRVLATRWLAAHLPRGARVAVLGSQVWFWGAPQMPPGVTQLPGATPTPAELDRAGVRWVVVHDHVLFSSRPDAAAVDALAPRLRLLVEFDPAVPGGGEAVFEPVDAYYLPIHGFGAVTRGGPRVRIYAFD